MNVAVLVGDKGERFECWEPLPGVYFGKPAWTPDEVRQAIHKNDFCHPNPQDIPRRYEAERRSVWTDTPPTRPGWYWWRDEDGGWEPEPVKVFFAWGGGLEFQRFSCGGGLLFGQWGPEIVLPEGGEW